MKVIASSMEAFRNKFRQLPLFRRLRPRIMTMMLTLVLPVSLICVIISIISIVQSSELTYQIGNNGLSSFLTTAAMQYEAEGWDPGSDFPAGIAKRFVRFCGYVEEWGGKVYVSRDGHQAFLLSADGSYAASRDYETLRQSRYQYVWQGEELPFQVLVTFSYHFALANVPFILWVGLLLSAVTVVLSPFLYKRLRLDILEPMKTLRNAIDTLRADNAYRIPPQSRKISDDFLSIFDDFNQMAEEIQVSHEKDLKLMESEMDNLRLQVNPHMLLNSYNMIYALAESKNYSVIQDYTLCLVDYFRYVLRRGQKLVSVGQELEFVENFIRIQRIRFPGRFSYVYQVDEDAMQAQIPPLLIENFVENAVKYALDPTKPIEIVVFVRKEADDTGKDKLHIAITDTGSGIRPEVLEKLEKREPYIDEAGHRHIGIYNCFRRIELFYGEEGDIHFSSGQNQGTQIYLVVPYILSEEEKEAQA